LQTLIEQIKAKKKSFYYYFVDFKNAFDIVSCEVLWLVLAGLRVEGCFLRCPQSMYAKDTVRINHPSEGVTSSFKCQWGLKQGCPFSPLLFGLYLDAFEGHLDGKKCDAPTLADALPSPGVNPLEGSPKCSCGKLGLGRRSRLPTLERGRRSSWEPRD
jgi:hypothetical protein